MLPLDNIPIQWKSKIFSTTIFLQLLIKQSLISHFHISIFPIFLKVKQKLDGPFLSV